MPAAVIGGGLALGGALIGARASKKGAASQAAAARDATAAQERMYDQTRADQAPMRQLGYGAVNELQKLLQSGELTKAFTPGDITNETGYQFGLQQGQRGLDSSAAARGMGLSGAALKAASRFNSDYATTRYNDAFNRFQTERQNRFNPLLQLSGAGAIANQQVQNAGQNYANAAGSNLIGAANAQAASGQQRANIYGNALNQFAAAGNQNNWWQQPSVFRSDDPYRNPSYYGGGEGE
jgi:hypothetical protein